MLIQDIEFAVDAWLDESDFEIPDQELLDFSADELDFEGDMDILDLDDFADFDFGDFDSGFEEFEM